MSQEESPNKDTGGDKAASIPSGKPDKMRTISEEQQYIKFNSITLFEKAFLVHILNVNGKLHLMIKKIYKKANVKAQKRATELQSF